MCGSVFTCICLGIYMCVTHVNLCAGVFMYVYILCVCIYLFIYIQLSTCFYLEMSKNITQQREI